MTESAVVTPLPGGLPPAVELRGIHKRFGLVHANRHIDLIVPAGTIHGIVGENGAGKSTLMNILYGYYQADGGQILVDGEERTIRGPQDAIRAGIGMVHQHEMLVNHADAGPDRILRPADSPLLAVDQDLPAVGLIVAVEDIHQRRLAGTVLAHDAVDGAGGDAEVDVAVGLDGAEALADATQLDRRRLRARRCCGSDRHRRYFWVE